MAAEKPPSRKFVNVDELMPQISLEQVAAFYGVVLPDLKRIGSETRAKCFLHCGKAAETGDRALAIQTEHPAKQWHCHQYGCGMSGNLVSLCDLLKPGQSSGGKPRGQRFKEIAADIAAMAAGAMRAVDLPEQPRPAEKPPEEPPKPKVNLVLRESENLRARSLTELDRKFVLDAAAMPPKASAYFRRRPFLTPETCRKWRMGYLPRDTGADTSGGTMRGKIVYAYLAENGDVLTWFGRDPEFEEKHKAWEGTDRSAKEPEKFHFVKGFHRGIELFGQHAIRKEGVRETLQGLGLIIVEGPNDVIRLDTLGIPAMALCSNLVTREQAPKVASLAREIGGGVVTVFLDCDEEGEKGMRQALGYLAPQIPVRLAWMSKMYGGKFKGRQPESLTLQEWQEIAEYLKTGKVEGWRLE